MNTLNTAIFQQTVGLYAEMIEKLNVVKEKPESMLNRAREAIDVCRETMQILKKMITDCPFVSPEEEIQFFKDIKPFFLSELIYYGKMYKLHARWPVGDVEIRKRYLVRSLEHINQFFHEHFEFYLYHRCGRTDLDAWYFQRNSGHATTYTFIDCYVVNDTFSTGYDILAANFLAFERFAEYLEMLLFAKSESGGSIKTLTDNKPKWPGTKVELVELAYSIAEYRLQSNGSSSVHKIALALGEVFNVDVSQYRRDWVDIRRRKSGKPFFLERLFEAFKKRLERDE
jgi:RteC protein